MQNNSTTRSHQMVIQMLTSQKLSNTSNICLCVSSPHLWSSSRSTVYSLVWRKCCSSTIIKKTMVANSSSQLLHRLLDRFNSLHVHNRMVQKHKIQISSRAHSCLQKLFFLLRTMEYTRKSKRFVCLNFLKS